MNRPFYAFGVLAVFLTLAMLGVSSSSRSTTTSSAGRARTGTSLSQRAEKRGGVYVIVMPAMEAPDASLAISHSPVSGVVGNDNAACGQCAPESYHAALGESRQTMTHTVTARIELASDDALLPPTAECRSLHDPDYDRAVYGDCPMLEVQSPEFVQETDLIIEDALQVFASIMAANVRPAVSKRSPASSSRFESNDSPRQLSLTMWNAMARHGVSLSNLRTMLLGIRNSLVRWLRSVDIVGPVWSAVAKAPAADNSALDWIDYGDSLDEIAASAHASSVQEPPDLDSTPVRSGRGLLRFAAARLNELGMALQAAANHLERLDGEIVAREPSELAR